MKKNLRRITTLGIGIGMLAVNILPLMRAWADAPQNWQSQYVEIVMRQSDSAVVGQNGDLVVTYKNNGTVSGTVTVSGAANAVIDNVTNYDYGNRNDKAAIIYTTATGGITLTAVAEQGYNVEYWDTNHVQDNNFNGTATLDALNIGQRCEPEFNFMPNGAPQPGPQGNTEATVTLRALTPEGYYERDVRDKSGKSTTEKYYYKNTYHEASFAINNGQPYRFQKEEAAAGGDYSSTTYYYDYDDSEGQGLVDITITTLWNWRLVDNYININGTNYPITINYDDQKSYLDHYGGQVIGLTIKDVPKSDNYDIRLDAMQAPREAHTWIGNFLWTSDPDQMYERDCRWSEEEHKNVCGEIIYDEDGNPVPGRDYIGHSKLALISVKFTVGNADEGYTTYFCSADTENCSWWVSDVDGKNLNGQEVNICRSIEECHVEYDDRSDAGYVDGSLVVPSGAVVTMQVIPDYGYQVMNVNMDEWGTAADLGYFTFTIPEGAAYFTAEVVETEDTVIAESEAIAEGTIDLGDGQTTIDHGTAKLEVNDVDLDGEDIAGFKNASGDYRISTYLDISLYNITCKGGTTCVGTEADSWSEKIDDLNEEATITLQLEEGIDGNEVVIVHQKHDGTYEIIPAVYDAATHTITFKTSSFSNYAIASKTTDSPNTGWMTNSEGISASEDNTITTIITVAIVLMAVALGTILCYNRVHDSRQKQD